MKKVFFRLLLNSLSFYLTCLFLGISLNNFFDAILAIIILGFLNTFLKPILSILTLPLNIITFGFFSFIINAIMLQIVDNTLDGLKLTGFIQALQASVILAIVSSILNWLVS